MTQHRLGVNDASHQGTVSGSTITLCTWAIGCGILSLPRAFALCGAPYGLIFLIVFAWWVDASLKWVVLCGRYSEKSTFKENALFYLGPRGAWIVYIGQIFLLFGGILAVFVTVASLLPCVPRDLLNKMCGDSGASPSRQDADVTSPIQLTQAFCSMHPVPCVPLDSFLILVTLIVLPLASRDSLHSLQCFSAFSLGCLIFFCFALIVEIYRAGIAMVESGEADLVLEKQSSPIMMEDASITSTSRGAAWQGPPILLMSFLCHTSILQLDSELCADAKRQVGTIIRTVIIKIAPPLYTVVGLGGYLVYGPHVAPNVLEDLEANMWISAAKLMLGLVNLIKIPLAMVALRRELVASIPSARLREIFRVPAGRFAATAMLLACAAVLSFHIGSLSQVLSLLGCTVGVVFSLCLPSAMYWQLLHRVPMRSGAHKASSGISSLDLMEPLLNLKPSRNRYELHPNSITVPQTKAGRICHKIMCGSVFIGGILIGCLGLAGWIMQQTG